MTDSSDSRRGFLKSSAAVTAASILAVPALARGIASPSNRIRVGAVGIRGRGRGLVNSLRKLPNVEIAALCDVQAAVLDARANECERADGRPIGIASSRPMRKLDSPK